MQERGQASFADSEKLGEVNLKRPVVLLAATCLWSCTPKLAILLARLGCDVAALAPRRHTLRRTRFVSARMIYHARHPLRALEEA
ncbi:MAG TPA: hypothetical protein VG983_00470, partial [Caulobacterales bacterium]|nr:hypothetical protein [Caulobacterales bacterium]